MVTSTMARIRACSILLSFGVPLCSGCAFDAEQSAEEAPETVSQGLASDVSVYTENAPATPWQSWSWSSTISLANSDAPLLTGSRTQMKATALSSGGALSMARTSGDLNVADYDAISFDVRATASSSVRLSLETLAGGGGAQAVVPVTTSWTRQTVKIDALRGTLTRFGKINWMGSAAGQSFYVDNVTVVAKKVVASASFPSAPLTVTKSNVVTLNSGAGPYSLYVPNAYDASHNTPTKLLLWLHGCGGNAYGDAWSISPGGNQSWLSVSVGGRDGECWNVDTDGPLALAALDDVKRRLNVDPRRVVIGGYSSGGDVAYRTAFYNARRFAGVIAENTSPFRDTGSSQSASLAAAAWKLNVAHVAHLSDATYPIAGVRAETGALTTAGYAMTRIERAGTHWDADTASSGTNYDMRTYLLPYLDAGWTAPP